MTYMRVIPRDLFNESKLLKCLGMLYIASETFPGMEIVHDGEPFQIEQNEMDGSIYVANVSVFVRSGEAYIEVSTPLNARTPYPMTTYWRDAVIPVFHDDGTLSDEFRACFS